jgi:hypothetical protein
MFCKGPVFHNYNYFYYNHSGDLEVNGRTILRYILRKYSVRVWSGFIWLRMGTGGSLM